MDMGTRAKRARAYVKTKPKPKPKALSLTEITVDATQCAGHKAQPNHIKIHIATHQEMCNTLKVNAFLKTVGHITENLT